MNSSGGGGKEPSVSATASGPDGTVVFGAATRVTGAGAAAGPGGGSSGAVEAAAAGEVRPGSACGPRSEGAREEADSEAVAGEPSGRSAMVAGSGAAAVPGGAGFEVATMRLADAAGDALSLPASDVASIRAVASSAGDAGAGRAACRARSRSGMEVKYRGSAPAAVSGATRLALPLACSRLPRSRSRVVAQSLSER